MGGVGGGGGLWLWGRGAWGGVGVWGRCLDGWEPTAWAAGTALLGHSPPPAAVKPAKGAGRRGRRGRRASPPAAELADVAACSTPAPASLAPPTPLGPLVSTLHPCRQILPASHPALQADPPKPLCPLVLKLPPCRQTTEDLIAQCKAMVDAEGAAQFEEGYINEADPSGGWCLCALSGGAAGNLAAPCVLCSELLMPARPALGAGHA